MSWLSLHVTSAVIMSVAGALQLRDAKGRMHRSSGYAFAVSAFAVSLSGAVLAWRVENIPIKLTLLWGASYIPYRTARAIQFARRHEVAKHSQQIISVYGLMLSAVTVRIAIALSSALLPDVGNSLLTFVSLWTVTIATLYATRKGYQRLNLRTEKQPC